MTTRDPSPLAILSARIMRAYPSLSPFSCASLAEEMASIERAQHRHAERCCSGEDGGYVRRAPYKVEPPGDSEALYRAVERHTSVWEHDPDAEQRAGARIAKRVRVWQSNLRNRIIDTAGSCKPEHEHAIELRGDPRGRVLLLQLPGESEPT